MALILVADDDAGVRHAIARLLRHGGGHVVMEADGSAAALQTASAETPDVVVTEPIMAQMPAVEYIGQLRQNCPQAGIVALSAGGAHQDPEFAMSLASTAGADAVLRKPVRNAALLEAVDGLLSS